MNSPDRAKKKPPAPAPAIAAASSHLWKKALLHFSLCFATGFFSGLAPFSSSSSQSLLRYLAPNSTHSSPHFPQSPIRSPKSPPLHNRTLAEEANAYDADPPKPLSPPPPPPRPLLIIVTAASASASAVRSAAALTRLGHTLRLVPPPLLWIVAGPQDGSAAAAAAAVRRMGVMQRHVAVEAGGGGGKGNAAERERAAAVAHVSRHRLDGVVHFADPANVYDLRFFDELRRIQVFGTWPAATVAGSRRRVVVEGPICRSSEVVGWFSKDISSGTTSITKGSKPLKINISDFAFNSSILWDQERWGRPNSQPDVLQDSIMSVQKMITEDDVKLKGIPLGCSQIMVWNLNIPRTQIRNRSKGE